jgi:hypothetical protein
MDEDERSFPGAPEFESVIIEELESSAARSAGSCVLSGRSVQAQFPATAKLPAAILDFDGLRFKGARLPEFRVDTTLEALKAMRGGAAPNLLVQASDRQQQLQ